MEIYSRLPQDIKINLVDEFFGVKQYRDQLKHQKKWKKVMKELTEPLALDANIFLIKSFPVSFFTKFCKKRKLRYDCQCIYFCTNTETFYINPGCVLFLPGQNSRFHPPNPDSEAYRNFYG